MIRDNLIFPHIVCYISEITMATSYLGKAIFNGGQINSDLQKERNTATFEVEPLKYYLNGGIDKYKQKVEIGEYLIMVLYNQDYLENVYIFSINGRIGV